MRRNALLTIPVGIALAVFLAVSSAEARPNPQMTCKGIHADQVRCEAKYVWPVIPLWTAGDQDYGKGYGEGFGMTMKLSGDWTLISMEVDTQVLEVEARMVKGKAEFRPVTSQIASKPP